MDIVEEEDEINFSVSKSSHAHKRSNSVGQSRRMVLLHSIIGYNGGHYTNYSRKGKFWYKFDDSNYYHIGSYKDLLQQLVDSKILPYFVVYKLESKKESMISYKSDTARESEATEYAKSQIMEHTFDEEKKEDYKNHEITQATQKKRINTVYTINPTEEESNLETSEEKISKRRSAYIHYSINKYASFEEESSMSK